ncbi:MAG TPA: amidohydrolase family protein [Candidatus Binatia bacterium]
MITDLEGREHFVIDQHVHVGMRPARSTTASSSYLPDELIANMNANGVDMVVGFPKANSHTDYRVENERIIAAMHQNPSRIIAFARINPYFGAKAVADVHDYAKKGAAGLKIHPLRDFSGNRVNDPELIFPIVQAAQEEKLLLLIHSGNSWNCAPTLIADVARNFPKANFVIAHSAGFEGHQEAIAVMRHQDNLYVDTASNGYPDITTNVVRAVGPERVIYGSDHPTLPFGFELGKIVKYAGLSSDQLDLILGKNLMRLLGRDAKTSAPKTMSIKEI